VTDRITGGLLLIVTMGYAYQAYHLKVGFMSDPIGPKVIIAGFLAFMSPLFSNLLSNYRPLLKLVRGDQRIILSYLSGNLFIVF